MSWTVFCFRISFPTVISVLSKNFQPCLWHLLGIWPQMVASKQETINYLPGLNLVYGLKKKRGSHQCLGAEWPLPVLRTVLMEMWLWLVGLVTVSCRRQISEEWRFGCELSWFSPTPTYSHLSSHHVEIQGWMFKCYTIQYWDWKWQGSLFFILKLT